MSGAGKTMWVGAGLRVEAWARKASAEWIWVWVFMVYGVLY
jgi:hypothetical protein